VEEPKKLILIADDEPDILDLLSNWFEDAGYQVSQARDGTEALAKIQQLKAELGVVLLDVQMPGMDGLTVLKQIKDELYVPIIVMTAFGTGSIAIKAMQQGAYDYVTKPFDDLEALLHRVERVFEYRKLSDEVTELKGKLTSGEKIIGNSSAMQEVYKTVGKVANSNATVLITGETGTGKELIANVIHSTSRYARGPFVAVNCGALPETLLESELFGYEAGAFTGAAKLRKGRFELAEKGTIFLDEIGECSASTQSKLLRVLQERVIDRLGGTLPIKIDVRVMAATNRDLEQEVLDGKFRSDLYYRLNVITIHMPPLRERKEDIPLLAEHFLEKHRYTPSSSAARLSVDAIQALQEYDWPGNVRELENVIQRAVVDARGGVITNQNLSLTSRIGREDTNVLYINQLVRERASLDESLANFERAMLLEAVNQGGNIEEAASLLSLSQAELQRRLAKYGLK
jgi:two-component system, NtrC family, response regulator AtoC